MPFITKANFYRAGAESNSDNADSNPYANRAANGSSINNTQDTINHLNQTKDEQSRMEIRDHENI